MSSARTSDGGNGTAASSDQVKKRNKKVGAKRGPRAADHGVVILQAAQRGNVRRGPEAPEHTTTHINEAKNIMSPSDKTIDVSSVLDQLKAKRAELAQAEAQLGEAEKAMDLEGVISAMQRVDVLRAFVVRLEVQEAGVLEQEGQRRARAWVTEQLSERATLTQKVAAAQKKVRSALDAAVVAIGAEVGLRDEAVQVDLASQVLCGRFGFARSAMRVSMPDIQDYGTPLLRAVDGLRPSHWGSRRLVVPLIASMTEEQRRTAHVNASVEFFAKSGKELPEEVQAIMTEAPVRATAPAPKPDADDAVIGTRPVARDPALVQAAAEIAALPSGVSAGLAHVHRG